MQYRFNANPSKATFGPKPPGDYNFVVTEIGDGPTLTNKNNWTLPVRLAIGDDQSTVFDNPWARSEQSETQDGRDTISEFLIAINMTPAGDKEPNWKGCVGKKGRCKIKIEDDQNGKPWNKVAFYYTPKQAEGMSGQSMPSNEFSKEFEKARNEQITKAKTQSGNPESDGIPY